MRDTIVVGRVPRVVYLVTGERPLAYLHDVLAQDVIDLAPGRGALAALLTHDGRIAAEVRVLPTDDGVLLDAEPEAREGIEVHLARHAGLAGCDVEELTADRAVASVRGPDAERVIAEAGLPVPEPREASFAGDEPLVVRVEWGVPGFDLIGDHTALTASPATLDELEAARIEAGRPRFGADFDSTTLVNETPLLTRGVSMAKGCYPGQETVARIHNLGRARRALRALRSSGSLARGDEILAEGAVIGAVTSATRVPSDGFAAIALVRSEVEPGTVVDVASTTATVVALP